MLPKLMQIKPKYDTMKYYKNNPKNVRNIVHIDMDCYFVSVALRDKPELNNKPCVVCHSKSGANKNSDKTNPNLIPKSQSTSEISSSNYVARKYGVTSNMLLGKALRLCPDLVILPYKFDDYN